MKSILSRISLYCLVALLAAACATLTPEQKAERERNRQQAALQDAARHAQAVQAVKDMKFVLEGQRLTFRRGETASVSPSINFISVDNNRATVQIGSYNGPGINGVGGITVEGSISNLRTEISPKGAVNVSMNVNGAGISATVRITMRPGSDRASATVEPNFNFNRLTIEGVIVPTSQSVIFKGMSL